MARKYVQMRPETLSAIRQHNTAIYLGMRKHGPRPQDDHTEKKPDEE